jgi:hypothetical protein
MRRIFRHILVWAVAVALVAGGAAWQPCLQLANAAAGPDHRASSHHNPTAAVTPHDHHAIHHDHGAPPPPPTADDHACMKCCAMCAMATIVPLAAAAAVPFTMSSPVAYRPSRTLPDNTVAVDPGIPKRIG